MPANTTAMPALQPPPTNFHYVTDSVMRRLEVKHYLPHEMRAHHEAWLKYAAELQTRIEALAALCRRADYLLSEWDKTYGQHQPQWLPPAHTVRLQEDIADAVAEIPDPRIQALADIAARVVQKHPPKRAILPGHIDRKAPMSNTTDVQALIAELRKDHGWDMYDIYGPLCARAADALEALLGDARVPMTEQDLRNSWQDTFSTNNPFCPCDLRSFTKSVRAAERFHKIG